MGNNWKKSLLSLLSYVLIMGTITGCDAKSDEVTVNDNMDNETEVAINGGDVVNNSESETIETPKSEFDYFETEKKEISGLLSEEKWEEAEEKAKDVFITGVDFIFYDKEINGVTWDGLKEDGKELTLNNLAIIDGWIMEIFPNYKENISDKYYKCKDFLSEQFNSVTDYVKGYISDDTLKEIEDVKDKVSDTASDVWDTVSDGATKGKAKVKSWYENFRNSN